MNLITTIEVYLLYILLALITAFLFWAWRKGLAWIDHNTEEKIKKKRQREAEEAEKNQQNTQDSAKPPGSTF